MISANTHARVSMRLANKMLEFDYKVSGKNVSYRDKWRVIKLKCLIRLKTISKYHGKIELKFNTVTIKIEWWN